MKTSLLLGTSERLSLLLAVLLAGISASPAMANPPTAVTCGSVITAPGEYFLAGDCTGPGITIAASNVHLKLDGHTMTGTGFRNGLDAFNVSNMHIEGPGTITSYTGFGIWFIGVSDSHVEQVNIINNRGSGFQLETSTNTHVNNSVFSRNGGPGILFIFNSNDNHVDNNEANGNSFGIFVESGSTSNHINGNTAVSNPFGDLRDDNANCDNNKWNGNTFGSANQSCIH